ncbi:hypothetical protein [Acidovorax sp.]|uniref:hypothetical protein n=1 Tax=Acidovorax sp. TaxID=1872122 RepID=UPI002ACE595D|nr:hypothetical protein [Acidovorax sp.]MDZ7865080.1 hypothetical protein [Acidovorax sp.]
MTKIDTIEIFGATLGRDISQEGGSCGDYLDVYNRYLDEVKKIMPMGSVYTNKFVLFLLGWNGDLGNTMSFIEYVVKGGEDINLWLKESYKSEWRRRPPTS